MWGEMGEAWCVVCLVAGELARISFRGISRVERKRAWRDMCQRKDFMPNFLLKSLKRSSCL